MGRVELDWDGKSAELSRVPLPVQVVENVDVARASRGTLAEHMVHDGEWRNRLIWGDNRYVLPSLAEELAGQVDLIYIDPPFDSRQDYKVRITIGDASADQELTKLQSMVEEKAYRDTWGAGTDSYLQMLYSRLLLLRDLLSDRGSIFLHLAPNVSHYGRMLMEEVFGEENLRAEIVWKRVTSHSDTKDFGVVHDVILCFSKTQDHLWNPQFRPHDQSYIDSHYSRVDDAGRRYRLDNLTSPNPRPNLTYEWHGFAPPAYGWRYSKERMAELDEEGRIWYPENKSSRPQYIRYLDESSGQPLGDVWDDIHPVNSQASERLGYDTQKPEALLERIIKSSSDEGSIVLDCFCGSGTTAAVAEKLGRRWVAVDIGRFAVHTTRKRLLEIEGCKPFVVANLGRYERQVWQEATTGSQVDAYLDFIVELYGSERLDEFTHLHGKLAGAAVHVGSVDAPVTFDEIAEALDEASAAGFATLDVLGWEWEMGLQELIQDEARERGLGLRLRRIPNEVMDKRAVVAGDITFHELGYLRVSHVSKGLDLTVTLEDLVLPNVDLVPATVAEKITTWSDYIDYWAVDFSYDGATFLNEWQGYRTRSEPTLDVRAATTYAESGTYEVVVKAIDVFGHDTTHAVKVEVG